MIKDQISFNITFDSDLLWDDSGAALVIISISCVLVYVGGPKSSAPQPEMATISARFFF
jgi:hypothetical protein